MGVRNKGLECLTERTQDLDMQVRWRPDKYNLANVCATNVSTIILTDDPKAGAGDIIDPRRHPVYQDHRLLDSIRGGWDLGPPTREQ